MDSKNHINTCFPQFVIAKILNILVLVGMQVPSQVPQAKTKLKFFWLCVLTKSYTVFLAKII